MEPNIAICLAYCLLQRIIFYTCVMKQQYNTTELAYISTANGQQKIKMPN